MRSITEKEMLTLEKISLKRGFRSGKLTNNLSLPLPAQEGGATLRRYLWPG
jgi:hypothetical protein